MTDKIVQFNVEVIKGQLKELVRGSVQETLNELLEKEAETLTQAAWSYVKKKYKLKMTLLLCNDIQPAILSDFD